MEKLTRWVLAIFVLGALQMVMVLGGFMAGRLTANASALSFLPGGGVSASAGGTPEELQATFKPFWEAWEIVHQDYAEQPVNDQALMEGALHGMLDVLDDPYTAYMTPEEKVINSAHLDGDFEGIGATVETDDETTYTRIVSPIAGSPAEAAGLLPGDLIITIDGEDIAGQDITTVVGKVRGPAGSQVALEIQREGHTETFTVTITRATIDLVSVESRLLTDNIGYLKINSFGEKTPTELRKQLTELMAKNPSGLILDLRGNPGGYLQTAINVVSQFISNGVVMIERFGDGTERKFEAESGGLATQIPLVVLIDKGSASASEIVAGAIQDRGRGQLVGETSFGKGSVQVVRTLSNEGGLRVTIARWLTPNGEWIHEQGIAPDFEIARTEDDRAAQRDPQLEKAIEILVGP
jgi:carboxyl-terminal processing protease